LDKKAEGMAHRFLGPLIALIQTQRNRTEPWHGQKISAPPPSPAERLAHRGGGARFGG
jgi:hypothetical protein